MKKQIFALFSSQERRLTVFNQYKYSGDSSAKEEQMDVYSMFRGTSFSVIESTERCLCYQTQSLRR